MSLANRLDKAMKDKGTTAYKIEQDINISRALIGKYLKGTEPSVNNILLLADYLEVPLDWLIRGDQTGDITNTITGDSNTTQSNTGCGHNVSIGGDTKAKKIIEKDHIIIELEQSAELYKQKAESLETRIRDLESLLKAKEEIIEMLKNKQ